MAKFALSLLLLTYAFSLNAKDNVIKFGTFEIPQFVKDSKSGEFIELVNTISKSTKTSITIEIYPPKRTIQNFSKRIIDAYFPSLDIYNRTLSFKPYTSEAFYIKRDYIFSLKNLKKTSNFRICLTSGYPYDEKAVKKLGTEIIYAKSDETCLKLLLLDRADYFICELASGYHALLSLGDDEWKKFTIAKKPFSQTPVFFAFAANERGKNYRNFSVIKLKG